MSSAASHLPRPHLRQSTMLHEISMTILLLAGMFTFMNLISGRYIVQGQSMAPTFQHEQVLFVSRINYMLAAPQRGDIVVFHYPRNPQQEYIKRVIGLPGETISIRDTAVYINDTLLAEPYITEACTPYHCQPDEWQLGQDEFFVMGDNRNNSSDSRAFGPVERQYLVGEVLIRYWPLDDLGLVHQVGMSSPAQE